MVIDTSALIAILLGEPEATRLAQRMGELRIGAEAQRRAA